MQTSAQRVEAQNWCEQTARVGAIMIAALVLAIAPATAGTLERTFSKFDANSEIRVDHSAWDGLLKTYIHPDESGLNRVDYAAFKAKGRAALKAYIASLQKVDVTKLDQTSQVAFWANLYNAKTIEIVLDHYPVKSIKKISLGGSLFSTFTGGPWDAKVVKINGVELTLNDIEHKILRKFLKDPRVHYAVNCASIGCPNLQTAAFTHDKLEDQLNAGAAAYINNPRGVTIESGKITASKIYSWFDDDFGGSESGVLSHLKKFAKPDLKAKLAKINAIDGYAYDWSLNDIAK